MPRTKSRKLEITQEQMDVIRDYANTFNTDSGRRVLEDLRQSFCGSCFVKGYPSETAYRCGLRDAVVKIGEMLKISELPVDVVEELTSEI